MTGFELVIVFGAVSLGAFVKAVTGLGFPLVAIPVLSLFLGVEEAVVIIAGPALLTNAWMLGVYRESLSESRHLKPLSVMGVVGALVGARILVDIDERVLTGVLALVVIAYIVMFFRSPDLRLSDAAGRRWSPAVGFAGGVLQGSIGVSGPVFATWVHTFRVRREAYVASISLLFGISGTAQLVGLIALGLFTVDRAIASALAMIPVFVFFPLGDRIGRRIAPEVFERVALAVLAGSAVTLIIKTVT